MWTGITFLFLLTVGRKLPLAMLLRGLMLGEQSYNDKKSEVMGAKAGAKRGGDCESPGPQQDLIQGRDMRMARVTRR